MGGWVGVTEGPIGATPSPPQSMVPLPTYRVYERIWGVPSDTAYCPKSLTGSQDPVMSRDVQHARFQTRDRGRATRRQENTGREWG